MKISSTARIVLPLVAVFAVLMLVEPRNAKWGYEYRQGGTWNYETLFARFDFPILKTQDQIDAERGKGFDKYIPYYRFTQEPVRKCTRALNSMHFDADDSLRVVIVQQIEKLYAKGIIDNAGLLQSKNADNAENAVIYIQKNKRAELQPAEEIMTVNDALVSLKQEIENMLPGVDADAILDKYNIAEIVEPNLIFDAATTNLVKSQTEVKISPTLGYVSAGQLIVTEGEVITAEVYQMLNSYKVEFENNYGHLDTWNSILVGDIFITMLLMLVLYLSIRFSFRESLAQPNKYLYLLFIYTITVTACLLTARLDENFILAIPIPFAALSLQSFFHRHSILPVYIAILMPLLLFTQNGILFFTLAFICGMVGMYAFKHFGKGASQFLSVLLIFLADVISYTSLWFMGIATLSPLKVLPLLFMGSIFVIAVSPLIYLFERVFGLVSQSRLEELSDTTRNKLLLVVEQRTPGTFQHSLQVSNLASAAARAIGADDVLVRCGALYHDIGKIVNPQCFVENESIVTKVDDAKYHQQLSALQSAQDILRHVPDGVELAKEYKLPQCIVDFILTHHGTSTTMYFYNKYVKEGGDESMIDAFSYKGMKPKTREQVLVMLADSLEAASRTLTEHTKEKIEKLVDNIVDGKERSGQLNEAEDCTFKDLAIAKEVFAEYLTQIYHERIVYPTKRKNNR